jgi:predicted ATPase
MIQCAIILVMRSQRETKEQTKITKLSVRNFKSLRDLDIVLGNLTMLIGPNEAGKSNIIDSLALLKDLFRFSHLSGKTQDPFEMRGGYKDVVWRGEVKEAIELSAEGHSGPDFRFEYMVRIEFFSSYWAVTGETLKTPSEELVQLRSSPTNWSYKGSSGSMNGNELALIHLQNELPLAKQIVESISGWRFYHLSPDLMSHKNQITSVRRLDDDGANLSALVHTLISEAEPVMDTIEENVKTFSPNIEKIIAPIAESGQTYVAVRERGLRQRIPSWAMSTGTLCSTSGKMGHN